MRMVPIFIKVHDLADPSVVYRINTNAIDYYRAVLPPVSKTPCTCIKLTGDKSVNVSESVYDIDYLLGVDDDD